MSFTFPRKNSADAHGEAQMHVKKKFERFIFIEKFTLTMDRILIVLLKHV